MACCESHSVPRMLIILITVVIFLADLVITIFSFLDADYIQVGLFNSTPSELVSMYPLSITPADWLQNIWVAIYIQQLVWIVYTLSTLCTKSEEGFIYFSPPFVSPAVYIFYSLGLAAHSAYLIMWDGDEIEITLGLIMGTCLFMYLAILVLMNGIHSYSAQLVKSGQRGAIIKSILFGCNFIAAYATWTTITAVFTLGVYLQYTMEWDATLVGTTCIAVMIFELFVYVLLDFVFCEQHFRYVYLPYMVVGVAAASISYQIWDLEQPLTVLLMCLMAIDGFVLLCKFIMSCVRSRQHPIHVSGGASSYDEGKPEA